MTTNKTNPARRNLSGIYIFDTLPGDDKRQPTCIEDCNEETRWEWLHSLSVEALQNCLDVIYGDIERIFSDRSLGIIFGEDEDEDTARRDDYIRDIRRRHDDAVPDPYSVNQACALLRRLADELDIFAAPREECEEDRDEAAEKNVTQ